ncbi:PREDICTED: cytochrome b561 and DOMON domain-containing protein At5g47530-like [Erythranthe guttata]|uniref:cytochrome b561 and DOMON domain-containing protein At5g47530-like n=1 Tax=Erythranthe guttata TaxID=4155 RepID=UPI00064D8391|nr:PREDICTED: cytochrome b561 and DOMON domain-containing protein At5g47530-like [Erythranthe guttata]|eukprot:XP_012830743.1 PREDICTED: cytochrome b561 and DOMON domain-containing protein At5g47530-like [Erythranthe guttata]
MDKFSKTCSVLHFLLITCCLFGSPSQAQNNCSGYTFSDIKYSYTTCQQLPVLNSFLHWNYHQSNHTIDIAYRHTGVTPSGWIVWALNPARSGLSMIGSQSLVAFVNSTTGSIHPYTSPISDYDTTLQPGPLSFPVPSIAAEFTTDNQMIIYATIQLPAGRTSFTHVWQNGVVSGNTPQRHRTTGDNMRSSATIDFSTGTTSNTGAAGTGGSRQRNRNVHGVLNVVSWGILMPVGAMAARYLKLFKSANPTWFYIHVACQSSAYIIGVSGWATGIKLGTDSRGVQQTTHRNIGITLYVLALLLRPKPDHKYRLYWNMYHHVTGYCVLILSIVNIFEGFEILDTEKKWETTYIGVLIFLGVTFLVLQAFTWFVFIKRKVVGHIITRAYI